MARRKILQDIKPIKKILENRKTRTGIFTVFLVGSLLVFIVNIIGVYYESKNLITNKNYKEILSEIEKLSVLSESSMELDGDLFEGSREILGAANHLAKIYENIEKLKLDSLEDMAKIIENQKLVVTESADHLKQAQEKIANAETKILPTNVRTKITQIKSELKKISVFIEKSSTNIPALEALFGTVHPHRYLILFQNNQESRPTGGFIGSVMLLDINDGKITKTDVIDVYELDGQFHAHIEPPSEIKELTPEWRLRDSNYWPDFSISGKKAAWFFQKEGGPSVDSVIAINQDILKELLAITGPIQVPGLAQTITSENYDVLLSYMIESKLSGPENPKEVLKALIPLVQKQLLKEENFVKVFKLAESEIARKNILAYSKNDDVQRFFDEIDVSGRMIEPKPKEDYLSVVTVSVSGNKSDKYMEQKISHSTWISGEGELFDQVAINRKHTWSQKELWKWWHILEPFGFTEITEGVKDILGRGTNKSIVRVYVPNGSELQETSSISDVKKVYDEESGREYFMFRMEVEPEKEKTVTLDYTLPFALDFEPFATYRLHIQKQSGNNNTSITKLISSENLKNHGNYPPESTLVKDKIVYSTDLLRDEYFSSLWGR